MVEIGPNFEIFPTKFKDFQLIYTSNQSQTTTTQYSILGRRLNTCYQVGSQLTISKACFYDSILILCEIEASEYQIHLCRILQVEIIPQIPRHKAKPATPFRTPLSSVSTFLTIESNLLNEHCLGHPAMASEEEISIQSMALQKRNAETTLMPPPPPPKRLKRPPKSLSEEDYTSAITTIIERDFYPNLPEMRKQSQYLDALEEGNPIRIATAARRLTTPVTGQTEETEEEKRERILKEDVKGMRLDMFQAKYTSEDNESFNALLDEQNQKQREKYAWMYNGNRKLTKQEHLIEQKRILMIEEGNEGPVTGERTDSEEWAKPVETWEWTPMNVLMNSHPGLEDQIDPSQGQKQIRHGNTRVPSPPSSTGKTPAPSPSLSTVQAAIQGRPSDTPRVNGYSFVSTPKVSELGAPKMTWGSLSSDPVPLPAANATPSPFRLAEPTEREKLARKLAEKAQKDITARQKAYTPSLRTPKATLGTPKPTTGKGGPTPLGRTPAIFRTPAIPKFTSSPDVRRSMLTPAGQRLFDESVQGQRAGMRERERKERESAAQVSGIGRTPLMREAKTPLIKK